MLGFRVWDCKDKCFYDLPSNDGLFLHADGCLIAVTATFDKIIDTSVSERYISMQYTGLKDKNGDEIFEGDILSNNHDHLDEGGEYDFHLVEDNSIFFTDWVRERIIRRDIVIIGNKYENPELLENIK